MGQEDNFEKLDCEILHTRGNILLACISRILNGNAEMEALTGELRAFSHAAQGSLKEFPDSVGVQNIVNTTLESA
jgi:hypothetical protein